MKTILFALILFFTSINISQASSHRDSPFLTLNPALDGTDLYAFTSYETGRADFITIIANYNPNILAEAPNYQLFDPTALYEIFIDTDGNAIEDHTFRFRFQQQLTNDNGGLEVLVNDKIKSLPFINNGAISSLDASHLGRQMGYTVEYIKGKKAYSYKSIENSPVKGSYLTKANLVTVPELVDFDSKKIFTMPEANIGSNSFSDYDAYANAYIYDAVLPDKKCETNARIFVGPRQNSFKANLSGIYDLANKNLLSAENGSANEFTGSNVLTIALEIPKACLNINQENPVIGVWATSSTPARKIINNKQTFGKFSLFSKDAFVQSSRLGNPLVNLWMVGYKDKNLFNTLQPAEDTKKKIDQYILYPSLPEYIEANFSLSSLTAPNLFPRTDLEQAFLTGFAGLNQSTSAKAKSAEILRLNTNTTALAKGTQNRLGYIAGDNAGYPNGRRPGDDVVDIFLRLLFGSEINDNSVAPSGNLNITDGVTVSDQDFSGSFPYLLAP